MITSLDGLQAALVCSLSVPEPLFDRTVAVAEPLSLGSQADAFGLAQAVKALIAKGRPLVLASLYPKEAFEVRAEPFADLLNEPFVTFLRLPAIKQQLDECASAAMGLPEPAETTLVYYRHRWIGQWYRRFNDVLLHRLTSQLLGLHTAAPEGQLTLEELTKVGRACAAVAEFRAQLGTEFAGVLPLLDEAQSRLQKVQDHPDDFAGAQDALFEFHRIRTEIERRASEPMARRAP